MTRYYSKLWGKIPEFSGWVIEDENRRAFCVLCQKSIYPTKTSLQKHSRSKLHCDKVKKMSNDKQRNENVKIASLKDCVPNNEMCSQESLEIDPNENIIKSESTVQSDNESESTEPSSWLNSENYTRWFNYKKGLKKVLCIACNSSVNAKRSTVDEHIKTTKHKVNTKKIEKPGRFEPAIAAAMIKIAAFATESNSSFLFTEKELLFYKDLVHDSKLFKNISMDRKKIRAIIENVLAPAHQERLSKILKKNKFSIEIDEATDISVNQCMCIVVRYFDEERNEIRESLWDLVNVLGDDDEHASANAETMFNHIILSFENWDIPITNVIACCSDTCSVMVGTANSVATKLKEAHPQIEIIKCSCHIEHLCAQNATNLLPCEGFASTLYNYMSNSSKKMHMFKVLQEKLQLNPLVLLRPIHTRWLAYYQCIRRILRRWSALIIFFEYECSQKTKTSSQISASEKSCEQILEYLKDPMMQLYHIFLETVLCKFVRINELLQNRKPIVPEVYDLMRELYIDLLKMYMCNDYVDNTPFENIDPCNQSKFKDLLDIDIGNNAKHFLLQKRLDIDNDDEKEFRLMCETFFVEACKKLKQRCSFQEKQLLSQYFHQKNALSKSFHASHSTVNEVFSAYPVMFEDENKITLINNEWQVLIKYNFPQSILNEKNVDIFWALIKNLKNEQGISLFENISLLALQVLCIPNANAEPERIWSKYNLEKTKVRNRLSFSSMRYILLTAQLVKDEGGILKFTPTDAMIEALNFPNSTKNSQIIKSYDKTSDSAVYYGNIEITEEIISKAAEEEVYYRAKYSDDNFDAYQLYDMEKRNKYIFDHIHDIESTDVPQKKIMKLEIKDTNKSNKNVKKEILSIDDNVDENERDFVTDYNLNNPDKIFQIDRENVKINSENDRVDIMNDCQIRSNIMKNGLVKNIEFYKYSSIEFTIGRYKGRFDHPIRDQRMYDNNLQYVTLYPKNHKFNLFSKEYQTLFGVGREGYIDGDVIDSFCAIREHKWHNISSIPTQVSTLLLVSFKESTPSKDWIMYNIKAHIKGKILVPYVQEEHWCLFVIDIDKRKTYHLDPRFVDEDSLQYEEFFNERRNQCFSNFQKYCEVSSTIKRNSLNIANDWINAEYRTERPIQMDAFNCGLFVMYYMDCIGRNVPFHLNFDPMKYRTYVAKLLLKKSVCMKDICLLCFSNKVTRSVTCRQCLRLAHERCLERYNINKFELCFLCRKASKVLLA